MEQTILPEEKLYRNVIDGNPNVWDDEHQRPSSAIFKDSRGVSVDRDGKRSQQDIIQTIIERFSSKKGTYAIVYLSAEECREENVCPEADPIKDNEYHALIIDSPGNIRLDPKKARALAKKARIAYQKL